MNETKRRVPRIASLSLASVGAFVLLLFFADWLVVLCKMGGIWAMLALVLVLGVPVAAFLVVDSLLRRPAPEDNGPSSEEETR